MVFCRVFTTTSLMHAATGNKTAPQLVKQPRVQSVATVSRVGAFNASPTDGNELRFGGEEFLSNKF